MVSKGVGLRVCLRGGGVNDNIHFHATIHAPSPSLLTPCPLLPFSLPHSRPLSPSVPCPLLPFPLVSEGLFAGRWIGLGLAPRSESLRGLWTDWVCGSVSAGLWTELGPRSARRVLAAPRARRARRPTRARTRAPPAPPRRSQPPSAAAIGRGRWVRGAAIDRSNDFPLLSGCGLGWALGSFLLAGCGLGWALGPSL